MLDSLDLSLTTEEIIYAALVAFFITWMIQTVSKLRNIIRRANQQLTTPNKDIQLILERCYSLFPKDIINFHGQTFKRGMKIKVTTLQNKSFEGEFIGTNSKGMVCIVTNKLVIAHELRNIENIQLLER